MADHFLSGETLDDVMRSVVEEIQAHGEWINPSKGGCTELTGVLLELTNARARLSRTETRGKPFSCLGELCWYLAGNNELEFISHYIADYAKYAESGIIFGGYGPRFFDLRGINQIGNVVKLLRERPDSRRAVIQLFDAGDILEDHEDVPCTCTLQFMIRHGALRMISYMRSNDAFLGLPHDIFCFTMIQEIMARTLCVELGLYKHAVGSLHLYDRNRDATQQFLDEGWQATDTPMSPMPLGDPWPAIQVLLKAERVIRVGDPLSVEGLEHLDPYWADLIRLLQVHRLAKDKDLSKAEEIIKQMASPNYRPFMTKGLSDARRSSN